MLLAVAILSVCLSCRTHGLCRRRRLVDKPFIRAGFPTLCAVLKFRVNVTTLSPSPGTSDYCGGLKCRVFPPMWRHVCLLQLKSKTETQYGVVVNTAWPIEQRRVLLMTLSDLQGSFEEEEEEEDKNVIMRLQPEAELLIPAWNSKAGHTVDWKDRSSAAVIASPRWRNNALACIL